MAFTQAVPRATVAHRSGAEQPKIPLGDNTPSSPCQGTGIGCTGPYMKGQLAGS